MDVKRSYSCGHTLHPRVTVLCKLSPIYFFPPDNFLNIFESKRITSILLLSNKKNIGYNACLKGKEHLVRYRALA